MEDFEKIVDDCLEMDRNIFLKKGEYDPETPKFLDIPDIDTKADTVETNEEEI